MSLSLHGLNCCGVVEISNLSEYEGKPGTVVAGLLKYFKDLDGNDTNPVVDSEDDVPHNGFAKTPTGLPTFFLFTEAADGKYGAQLAAYIRKHELGKVAKAGPEVSSRTGNKVTVYTWVVAHKSVIKWAKKNPKALCTCQDVLDLGDDDE